MVVAVGRNPERREDDTDADGVVHNNIHDPEALVGDNIEAVAPHDDPEVTAEAVEMARENADFQALQNAPMQPEPHMGGEAPTAPMMAPEEEATPAAPSESLGDGESQADALVHGLPVTEGSADAAVDGDLSEAGPSDVAGTA